jgi:hypothetical protein
MRRELVWALVLAPFFKVALVDGARWIRSLLRKQKGGRNGPQTDVGRR